MFNPSKVAKTFFFVLNVKVSEFGSMSFEIGLNAGTLYSNV